MSARTMCTSSCIVFKAHAGHVARVAAALRRDFFHSNQTKRSRWAAFVCVSCGVCLPVCLLLLLCPTHLCLSCVPVLRVAASIVPSLLCLSAAAQRTHTERHRQHTKARGKRRGTRRGHANGRTSRYAACMSRVLTPPASLSVCPPVLLHCRHEHTSLTRKARSSSHNQ
jgi:hypothetical protein